MRLSVLDLSYSPIRGPEGNIEYLGRLREGVHAAAAPDIAALVAASHGELEKKELLP